MTVFIIVTILDLEIFSNVSEVILDRFLTESWHPGNTCVSTSARDLLEQYLPHQHEQQQYGAKINKCYHLDTNLSPPKESYLAFAPVKHVLATDKSKLLSCTIVTETTIGVCSSNKLLKVLFDSESTMTMIHCSSLPTKFQWISNLPLLQFQSIWVKTT